MEAIMANLTKLALFLTVLSGVLIAAPAGAVPPPWAHERNATYNFQPDYYAPQYPAGSTVVIVHDREPAPAVAQVPEEYDYYYQDGKYCREYRSQVQIGGNVRNTYGTACQQPGGQWELVN